MTWTALGIVVAAMLMVRIGWAGRRETAWGGWIAATGALVWLTLDDGAWGMAIGTAVGIAVALILVLHAAWISPAKVQRAPREAPTVTLPRRWGDLGRQVGVFVLVVPVGFVAAQWLAFGAQAVARRGGATDADAIALTFLLQPALWGVIITVQMTRAAPARMLAAPAVAALLGTLLWSAS